MKVTLHLSYEDAAKLRGILSEVRRSAVLNAESLTWRVLPSPSWHLSLEEIVSIEDVISDISSAIEDGLTEINHSPYIKTF